MMARMDGRGKDRIGAVQVEAKGGFIFGFQLR